jgi:chaperonin GroES
MPFMILIWRNNNMSLNLTPLYDRVVIKPASAEKTSAGGIVIPDSAASEKPMRGVVLTVGSGRVMDDGSVRNLTVKAGDNVLYGKYAGTEVKLDGEDVMIMREDDVMAIIED